MTIHELATDLNRRSVDFEIGSLQKTRVCLRGLKRAPCRGIFNSQTIHDGYAFHVGGRKELQFNIGEEQCSDIEMIQSAASASHRSAQHAEMIQSVEMIRYGVAFSLELSQTLPKIDPLLPKIERFNDYVNSHLEDFPGFLMWHYHKKQRSQDRPVGPITDALFKPGTFIMLGKRVADNEIDVREILTTFDSLLPLYEYVESVEQEPPFPTMPDFTPGCPRLLESTTASQTGQTVDVALRHNTLQKALYKHLCREVGCNNVQVERPLALGVRVDAAVRRNGKESFYEVKVAPTVRSCVRAALGQLMEYCYWPSANRASEIVVVGEAEFDSDSKAYLRFLRQRFGLPLWYRRIDINRNILEKKS